MPPELAACGKIKIDGCPVKDSKVKKYVEKAEIKNLLKYLEKQAPSGGGGGSKEKRERRNELGIDGGGIRNRPALSVLPSVAFANCRPCCRLVLPS